MAFWGKGSRPLICLLNSKVCCLLVGYLLLKLRNDFCSVKLCSEEKAISIKFQSNMDEKNRRIKELELEVENEKMEQKKQLDLLDQEVILIPLSEQIIGLTWPCYSNNSIASHLNYSNKLLTGCTRLCLLHAWNFPYANLIKSQTENHCSINPI